MTAAPVVTFAALYPPRPRPRDAKGRFRALTKEESIAYFGVQRLAVTDLLAEGNAVMVDLPWKEASQDTPPVSWRR